MPSEFKLGPDTSGVKMMLDILHGSRMQFPGTALGFIKRMLDECIKQCKERIVGGKKSIELDKVRYQIARVRCAFTEASAMCFRSSGHIGTDNDLSDAGAEANTMKAFVTDLMQETAQIAAQLHGSTGFKMDNIAGRDIMDSRAFQIFEGSNGMPYTRIAETIGKLIGRNNEYNAYSSLKGFSLTDRSRSYFKSDMDLTFALGPGQRKSIDLGKILSRIISLNFVFEMEEKGFRNT